MCSQQTMPKQEPQSLGAPLLAHRERERERFVASENGGIVCIYIYIYRRELGSMKYGPLDCFNAEAGRRLRLFRLTSRGPRRTKTWFSDLSEGVRTG
jgi:hypothetical protein